MNFNNFEKELSLQFLNRSLRENLPIIYKKPVKYVIISSYFKLAFTVRVRFKDNTTYTFVLKELKKTFFTSKSKVMFEITY